MTRAKKWLLAVSSVVVILILLELTLGGTYMRKYDAIRNQIWQVELGSSMEEVSELLPFEPIRVSDYEDPRSGAGRVVWSYDHQLAAAVLPSIVFDGESRRVVAVYVDDARYRVSTSESQ
jgi:hypothetical protein